MSSSHLIRIDLDEACPTSPRIWVLSRNTSLINLMRGYREMPAKPPPKKQKESL